MKRKNKQTNTSSIQTYLLEFLFDVYVLETKLSWAELSWADIRYVG